MTQRMTNRAQDALDAKLKQIESLVKGIDYNYAQEYLKALLRDLNKAKKVAQILKTEIEVAERDFAEIEVEFKKYQASVDAGYDDKETLALRDSHGYNLEEIQECLVQMLREREQVMRNVSELENSIAERSASLEAIKLGYEPEPEFKSPEDIQKAIGAMVLCTEYRSGWSSDPSDLEAAQIRMTLAVGGPSIYLTADYDDGEINNAELSCVYWDEQAHTQDKQDVLLKFMSF